MPGTDQPYPLDIKLCRGAGELELRFSDGLACRLSAEYLRVFSPSADVKGHGAAEEGFLVPGKSDVTIKEIAPVGRYAIQLVFSDRHSTGFYTWATLYDLSRNREQNWQRYLERLAAAGLDRTPKHPIPRKVQHEH